MKIDASGPVVILKHTEGSNSSLIQKADAYVKKSLEEGFTGTVYSIGNQCWKREDAPRCKVGDKVVFARYQAYWLQDPVNLDDWYGFLGDVDVLGVVNEDSK